LKKLFWAFVLSVLIPVFALADVTITRDGFEIPMVDRTFTLNKRGSYTMHTDGDIMQGIEIIAKAPITLTLDNVSFDNFGTAIVLKGEAIVLNLVGENSFLTFINPPQESNACIYSEAPLSIEGTGTLNIQLQVSGSDYLSYEAGAYGIRTSNNDLIINSGNLYIDCYSRVSPSRCHGLSSARDVILFGSSIVVSSSANGGGSEADCTGIYAERNVVVEETDLKVTSTLRSGLDSQCIKAGKDITFKNSSVDLISVGGATNYCLFAGGIVNIQSGKTNILALHGETVAGIFAKRHFFSSNDAILNVKAWAPGNGTDATGIRVHGNTDIKDSKTNIEANGAWYGRGIHADRNIYVDNGSINTVISSIYQNADSNGLRAENSISITNTDVEIDSGNGGAGVWATDGNIKVTGNDAFQKDQLEDELLSFAGGKSSKRYFLTSKNYVDMGKVPITGDNSWLPIYIAGLLISVTLLIELKRKATRI